MKPMRLLGSCGFAVTALALGIVLGGCDSGGAPVTPDNSIPARQPTRDPGGSGAPGVPGAPGGAATTAPGPGGASPPGPGGATGGR